MHNVRAYTDDFCSFVFVANTTLNKLIAVFRSRTDLLSLLILFLLGRLFQKSLLRGWGLSADKRIGND